MSLSKWKELADRKAKTGEMKRNLFDEITEEKIRSKTTDQAIAKTFRLDRLDQIAEQTKPKPRRRIQIPRINREGGIDYAPEVDPYEDMDVEGLLNLEDYVPPQAEKQIAKIPKKAPKYEMDPSFWQLSDPPPTYEDIFEEKDPLAIEEESDIIYSFGTSTLRASYGFVLEPRRVIFNPVNKTSISSIRIYITDGLRRPVYLNNADTAFSLILKSA